MDAAQRQGRCALPEHANGGGFIGCLFGMYGTSAGQPTVNTASFKWLKYEGHDPMYKK
ncbi:hypothetical protein [Hymenobacter sp. HDW8]|uniref:beta-xylosidase family glycoside hydrolase n=1 Tax=Hymenobacter sp. HDW8 TaxID=2714932 RepID=UPI00293BBDB1|nr:hypothetical protein [Hymenobacter sp. HDW8]